jgi:hypothetical protein
MSNDDLASVAPLSTVIQQSMTLFLANIIFAFMERNTVRLGLWCLMPLSTIFQLYRGGQFYWWRKPEYLEKTTDLLDYC